MSPCEILQSKGIKLKIIGEELSLSPREKVTSEIVQFAKKHKQDIMAELQTVIYRIQVMDAIYQGSVKKVREAYENGELIPDRRIEAVSQVALKGEAKLKDFQAVVDKAFLN